MKEIGLIFIDVDFNVFIDFIIDIIIALYVDDVLIIDPFRADIQRVKNALYAKFKMSDLDSCAYYLDIIIIRDRINRTLRLKQSIYIERFLKQHDMWESKSQFILIKINVRFIFIENDYTAFKNLLKIYQFVIKFLIYAMLDIRSNIVFVISMIFYYAINFIDAYHFIIKRIFRYLRIIVN